jgi:hypothetical protein
MDQTCPKYTYNGLWSEDWESRDEINQKRHPYPQRYKFGSTYCENSYSSNSTGNYFFTGVDLIPTGCGGFTATFGCDTGTDQINIGDLLKTDSAMFVYGVKTDDFSECRKFNIWEVMNQNAEANSYPIGDYSQDANQLSDQMMDAQTRIFLVLLSIAFLKEILGVIITIMTYINHGYTIDINVDYVSVGKDSIFGLMMLLWCLYKMPKDEIGLYAERYKQLEDGYTVEEIQKQKAHRAEKLQIATEKLFAKAMRRRAKNIKHKMQPAQIKMPGLHEFDDIPISHQNKDGSYHIVDNHDIPPLIEPYTIFYQLWNIFEFCESCAGLAFGVVYFIRLGMITDPLEVPLPPSTSWLHIIYF